jgi:hypothetical protein
MSDQMMTCSYDNGPEVEPTCPACGHYNAMLGDSEAPDDGNDNRKCRDCGTRAVRLDPPHHARFSDEWDEAFRMAQLAIEKETQK